MTVGLPGSGIGGVFYLISALSMPVHAAIESVLCAAGVRANADRRSPRWSLVWKQFAIAVGIIAALWVTGLALAALLIAHPNALGSARTTEIGGRLPNILRVGAIIVSVGTLSVVLAAVQVARLVMAAAPPREIVSVAKVASTAAAILLLFAAPSAAAQSTVARDAAARHMSIADRAFNEEDTASARREYEAALAANPGTSRALYRLGQLARSDLPRAVSYYRRYVALEPGDAWGWIALGDTYARSRRYSDARAAYDRALAIAPRERDVVVGRARILSASGRTDDAILAYETWLSSHHDDLEASRELAVQRRRAGRYREAERAFVASAGAKADARTTQSIAAVRGFSAPAFEVRSAGSRDSDANQSARLGIEASIPAGDRARMSVSGGRRWVSGYTDVTIDEGAVGLIARPLAEFQFQLAGGIARPRSTITKVDTIPGVAVPVPGNGTGKGKGKGNAGSSVPPPGTIIRTETESANSIFVGMVRGVLRQPGGRSSLDLRATRTLLDATPVLVANRVVRNEVAGRADLEVLPRIKLRAGGRAGSYNATGDANTRVSLLGGLAVAASDAIEVSGVFQRLSFSSPTTSGYFAPRVAQLAEGGTYAEFETEAGIVLAIDAGAGAQRQAGFGEAISKWEPAYRLFSSLDVPIRPGSFLHLELDSYDSRLGSEAASSTGNWRYLAFAASVRLALR